MTVREWLGKPRTVVTRGELAAFSEALVKNQVKDLIRIVVERNNAHLHGDMMAVLREAMAEQEARRWYRRLGRWLASFGHRQSGPWSAAVLDPPAGRTPLEVAEKMAAEAPEGAVEEETR
jgi:hypothetical protein